LKPPWAVSYSTTNSGGASANIYACFEQKSIFAMQNFPNLGASGGGVNHFLTKPPKGTSLPDFTRFEPLCVQIRSRVFFARRLDEKRDTTKSPIFAQNMHKSIKSPHPIKFN